MRHGQETRKRTREPTEPTRNAGNRLLLLLGLVLDSDDGSTLLENTLSTALAHGLVAHAAGLHLVGKVLRSGSLGLGLVDVLHENTLVLEDVTLGLEVELVVEVLVDLARLAVLAQESAEDTLASHPHDLGGHTGLRGTLAVTLSGTTAGTLGGGGGTGTRSRAADDGLADDLAVTDELADVGTRVGVANVVLLGGVEPDLALTASEDRGREALLCSKVDHLDDCDVRQGAKAEERSDTSSLRALPSLANELAILLQASKRCCRNGVVGIVVGSSDR